MDVFRISTLTRPGLRLWLKTLYASLSSWAHTPYWLTLIRTSGSHQSLRFHLSLTTICLFQFQARLLIGLHRKSLFLCISVQVVKREMVVKQRRRELHLHGEKFACPWRSLVTLGLFVTTQHFMKNIFKVFSSIYPHVCIALVFFCFCLHVFLLPYSKEKHHVRHPMHAGISHQLMLISKIPELNFPLKIKISWEFSAPFATTNTGFSQNLFCLPSAVFLALFFKHQGCSSGSDRLKVHPNRLDGSFVLW